VRHGLPGQRPIPRFIQAIRRASFDQALEIIPERELLPAVCGRVCPQESQCEQRCTLGRKFESVAIGRLERFAADQAAEQGDGDVPVGGSGDRKKGRSLSAADQPDWPAPTILQSSAIGDYSTRPCTKQEGSWSTGSPNSASRRGSWRVRSLS